MRKLFAIGLVAAGMLTWQPAEAKITHLLPKPQQVSATGAAAFTLGGTINLTDPTNCELLKEFFTSNGCTLGDSGKPVTVEKVSSIDGAFNHNLPEYPDEAYSITVTADAISIKALTETGVIRAAQSLAQMALPETGSTDNSLEACTIVDWPAFKLRGYMHDVGRSFITVEELKKEIRLLSQFKVNTFHWHLTENQAWRFEVNSHPELTADANMTRFAGQYYTQAECREVVEYAAKYGMIVIPEIDMPGHSEAFTRAEGVAMQTDKGKEVLLDVLTELKDVFGGLCPYIHIGADETAITDTTFMPTMTDKLHELGFKVVCWNNAASGFTISKDNGIDMTQMWATAGKVKTGMPNIDCRYNYANHFDVFADLVGIYKSNIYYEQKGTDDVAGAICAYWNDRKLNTQEDIIAQNNVFATTIATAERAWIGGGKQYIEVGGTSLPNSGDEFDEFADWERRFLFHKANSLKDEPIPYVKQTNVKWYVTDPFANGGDSSTAFPPEYVRSTSYSYQGNTYGVQQVTGAGIYLRHTWGGTVPGLFGAAAINQTAYAYTYIYSPIAQTVGAQIEFQNCGRSERDTAPDNGTWDRKGSRIWLNGEEIEPPTWTNAGKSVTTEDAMGNENFPARSPIAVELKQGWNEVFIKLPYVTPSGYVRLNKWLYTFVLTDLEGKNAIDGLIYSPSKCIDSNAEAVNAALLEAKNFINSLKDMVGYYSANDKTAALSALVAEIEATLSDETVTAETRTEQIEKINTALEAAQSSVTINVTPEQGTYYKLSTPQRDGRYVTSTGAGAGIMGTTEATDSSAWTFVTRTDGTYDIQNLADKSYIAPTASNNSQLSTSTTAPDTGWTIKPASTVGYVIVTTSTGVQLHQTASGLGYKVYNWGSGTNTTDAGCQFLFSLANEEVVVSPLEALMFCNSITSNLDNYIQDEVGHITENAESRELRALAAELIEKLDLTQATMSDEALKLYEELNAKYETFQANLDSYFSTNMVQPKDGVFYNLCTPLRDNRYVTTKGVGQIIYGETTVSDDAAWAFHSRGDGTYDVVSYTNQGYLNSGTAKNNGITTVADAPAIGWSIAPAATRGYVIIKTSAGAELNQTNNGNAYKIFNWGDGTNTSDTGCQYKFIATDLKSLESNIKNVNFGDENAEIRILGGKGQIRVFGSNSAAKVYNAQGQLIAEGQNVIHCQSGVNIVVINGVATRVLVR
jgi:hypothetical protein